MEKVNLQIKAKATIKKYNEGEQDPYEVVKEEQVLDTEKFKEVLNNATN